MDMDVFLNPDEHSSSMYMYEKLMEEGHDARLFRFSAAQNGGGHRPPENAEYWTIGCLGITEACSQESVFGGIKIGRSNVIIIVPKVKLLIFREIKIML